MYERDRCRMTSSSIAGCSVSRLAFTAASNCLQSKEIESAVLACIFC
jgi:hypothetical protein